MRANTHVTLVIDNTAPQTQRSKCATSPQPFLTDQHPIYGGKAEVVRTQQSGGYWYWSAGDVVDGFAVYSRCAVISPYAPWV